VFFSRQQVSQSVAAEKYPLHIQFAVYLLNAGMGMSQDYLDILNPEIQEVIANGYTKFGKTLRFEDIIKDKLLPNTPIQNLRRRDDSLTECRKWIDKYILPTYLELLELDHEEVEKQQDQQSGLTAEMNKEAAKAEQDMAVWKDILKNASAKKVERNLTDEEMANKKRHDDLAKIWDDQEAKDKSGRSDKTGSASGGERQANFADFYNRLQKMRSVSEKLKQLWQRICHIDETEEVSYQGHYKTGSKLDIKKTIREMPTILSHPEQAEIFERKVHSFEQDVIPKNFSITLLLDESGSMHGKKIEAVKDFTIAMADSLGNFNAENSRNARRKKIEPIHAELEIIGYDRTLLPILEQDKDIQIGDIMQAYGKILARGGTNDKVAFEYVLNKIRNKNSGKAKKLKDSEDIQIVLEITDGDTDSGDIRQQLETLGVIACGILVGGANVEKFRTNFPNSNGVVIDNIDKLPTAVELLIEKVLDKKSKSE
jgi:uncharacterized protein YegL